LLLAGIDPHARLSIAVAHGFGMTVSSMMRDPRSIEGERGRYEQAFELG
jgi:hypothetical protein